MTTAEVPLAEISPVGKIQNQEIAVNERRSACFVSAAQPAGKFERALNLIARAKLTLAEGGGSCILHSLCVRDFLRTIGFAAEVRSVALAVRATRSGRELYSTGAGLRALFGMETTPDRWDGHLVVTANGVLIDPTFFQLRHLAWQWTPDVMVARLIPKSVRRRLEGTGLPVMAAAVVTDSDYRFEARWAANPGNAKWMKSPAATAKRDKLVKSLVASFGR